MHKVHGSDTHVTVQHAWTTVAKITAEFELEDPVLLWNPDEVSELRLDKDVLKATWLQPLLERKRDQMPGLRCLGA